MKVFSALILLVLAFGGIAWEWMWRMEHFPTDSESALSPSGQYLAQVRTLSEGDAAAPYGQGVFLRRRQIPLWSTSTLVFAGYCKPEVKLEWLSPQELVIGCITAEGAPKLLPVPKGIVVAVSGGGS